MVSYEGIEIGFAWVLMLVLLRHSRAVVRPADVLLLVLFTLSICLRVRMITWYAPVFVMVLFPHLADVAEQLRQWGSRPALREFGEWLSRRSLVCTALTMLMVWIAFAFSPASRVVLGGKPRPVDHVYGKDTPRGITEYLREHPPRGQIANPQWWGDWLAWDGPIGLQVFMTTNAVHVAPQRVWKDYLAIARSGPGLQNRLDRYRVNTIVVHKELQQGLSREVRLLAGWKIAYEDDLGLIVTRDSSARSVDEDRPSRLAGPSLLDKEERSETDPPDSTTPPENG
jgi:hypothetical protein